MEERGSEGGGILDEEGAGDGEEAGWSGPMTSARGVRRTACSSTVACEDDTHVVASLHTLYLRSIAGGKKTGCDDG